jgi:serine/threonine-protein kinase
MRRAKRAGRLAILAGSTDEPTLIDGPGPDAEAAGSDTLKTGEARALVDEPPLSEFPIPHSQRPPEASGDTARSAASDSAHLTQTLAIRDEQAVRGRAISWIGAFGGALMAVAIQIPERRPPGHWAATAALLAIALMSVIVLLRSRGQPGVDRDKVFQLGLVTTPALLVVTYYTGPFSPAALALILGIYFFGLGDSQRHALTILALCVAGYAGLGFAATARLIPVDRSLLPLGPTSPVVHAISTVVVTTFLVLTYWLARISRAATLRAMSELERARHQIRQREALLDEARADLNHVLDAGRMGRYSGRSVGPYVLDEIVGRGAMGEVYSALDPRSSGPVAVKLLHPYVLDEPTHVERFFREAEATSALASIHIVKVLGSGFTDDGAPYIAMERLIGKDLAWHLRERRRLKLGDVLDLVSQVSQALAVAQDAGIVHRDLKPQNLFLSEMGGGRIWKVLDFGVSKIAGVSNTLTHGAAVGTPSYMSPEQARARDVDHRADIFGLGVIAYRCLTGRPAFTGSDPLTTMYNVVHMQPARPSDHVPVHEDIELTLALALAKSRERRFPSAEMLAASLRDASRGQLDARLRRDARELLEEHPWGLDSAELPRRHARKSQPSIDPAQLEITRRRG